MERTDFYINSKNYAIPVTEYIGGDGPVTVALHGFGGDRNSSVIRRLAEKTGNVVCFDLPAHGDSPAPDTALTAENCMSDFAVVLSNVRNKYPGREVRFFATSFGGYILLNCLDLVNENEKIVLRAPAVKMAETYRDVIARSDESEILEREFSTCGFERKINVTPEYYVSLLRHDAMSARDREMLIIHGDMDTAVLPADIDEFCVSHPSAVLVKMNGADHRLKGEGQTDDLISHATKWFGVGTMVKKG